VDDTTRQQKERTIWDKQASKYDDHVFKVYRNAYDLSIEKVRSVLTSDQQVLEIGCGSGIIALGITPYAKHLVSERLK